MAGILGLTVLAGGANAAVVILDPFEGSEGRFTSSSAGSGSSTGFVAANTTIVLDTTTGQNSSNSQKLTIDDDVAVNVASDNWRFRNLSGGGTPANNVLFDSTGFVGYWAKTTTPNLQASILMDDGVATERGRFQAMIADGEWHAYEWNMDATVANTEWAAFAGTGANGLIDAAQLTIDSTYTTAPFIGGVAGETDAIYNIDNVSINPTGSITAVPEPTLFGLLVPGTLAVLARRRRH
jgi:hypothetical protein